MKTIDKEIKEIQLAPGVLWEEIIKQGSDARVIDIEGNTHWMDIVHPFGRHIRLITTKDGKSYDFTNIDMWKDYTTVGRIIFNGVVPSEMGFINRVVDKKVLAQLVEECFAILGNYETSILLEKLKDLGYME